LIRSEKDSVNTDGRSMSPPSMRVTNEKASVGTQTVYLRHRNKDKIWRKIVQGIKLDKAFPHKFVQGESVFLPFHCLRNLHLFERFHRFCRLLF
jgi:hypothetical protein